MLNSFMMEAIIIWFLYDNGLRHERVETKNKITRPVCLHCSKLSLKTSEPRCDGFIVKLRDMSRTIVVIFLFIVFLFLQICYKVVG